MKQKIPKIVFITWQPYCSRSDNIAREFGGKSYKIYYDSLGSNYYTIAFKYFLQTIKTMCILLGDRPNVVFVMSPSVFATIAVYLIDAHTGAMTHAMWKKVMFVQDCFCRRVLLTIVTNESMAKSLVDWGARYKIVPDVPIKCNNVCIPKLKNQSIVTLINTFATDEPLPTFLEATKRLKNVHFYITGKIHSKTRRYVDLHLDNVSFTDFLQDDKYYGLILASSLIVVLTTRDHTMQRGAYEAVYMGKPVVTSNWGILRENFPVGTVFVDNTVKGIVDGISEALAQLNELSREAQSLRSKKIGIWREKKTHISGLFSKIK